MRKDGKYFHSKFRNSGATTINPPKSKRFPSEKPYSPGPSTYETGV